jgi:CHAD domain-containing protein
MAYRLKPGEGMASGVRRIVDEELEQAIAQLEGRGDPDPDAAVHDARKRLKKARSAMRLVRDDLGDVRPAENAVLRDAARAVSGVRDAHVLLRTLEATARPEDGSALPDAAVAPLRRILEERRDRLVAAAHADGGAAVAAAAEIGDVRVRVPLWPLEEESFAAARAGLLRQYRRGRRAMSGCLGGEDDDEAWHEWRKRVKDLWYALRILEPVAPAPLGAMVAEADALGDVLGEHNDVAVLASAVTEHEDALEPADVTLLREAIRRRRAGLRRTATPLGRRLYAERPKALGRRLQAYWDARPSRPEAEALPS